MVAYSFRPMFADQVSARIKRQTIRADRKRHARPGERLQLFTGMRTRQCRKLIADPICLSVQHIEIRVSNLIDALVASVVIDGFPLDRDQIEVFARADGFAPELLPASCPFPVAVTARENMGRFWMDSHGVGRFEGVLICWVSQP